MRAPDGLGDAIDGEGGCAAGEGDGAGDREGIGGEEAGPFAREVGFDRGAVGVGEEAFDDDEFAEVAGAVFGERGGVVRAAAEGEAAGADGVGDRAELGALAVGFADAIAAQDGGIDMGIGGGGGGAGGKAVLIVGGVLAVVPPAEEPVVVEGGDEAFAFVGAGAGVTSRDDDGAGTGAEVDRVRKAVVVLLRVEAGDGVGGEADRGAAIHEAGAGRAVAGLESGDRAEVACSTEGAFVFPDGNGRAVGGGDAGGGGVRAIEPDSEGCEIDGQGGAGAELERAGGDDGAAGVGGGAVQDEGAGAGFVQNDIVFIQAGSAEGAAKDALPAGADVHVQRRGDAAAADHVRVHVAAGGEAADGLRGAV